MPYSFTFDSTTVFVATIIMAVLTVLIVFWLEAI